MSWYRSDNLGAVRSLQLLIKNCSGVPSPGAREIDGTPVNMCPSCGATAILGPFIAGPFWRCGECSWNSQQGAKLCPCQRIGSIRQLKDGRHALPLDGADATSARLNSPQKATITSALGAGVEIDEAQLLPVEVSDE